MKTSDQKDMMMLKRFCLLFLLILFIGCGAGKAKPAVPLASTNVRLDPICEVRAILKYDRGEGIETDGQKKAEEAIHKFCHEQKHKVLVDGERLSGEKKWTKIIVFECIQ
jgi:hypothetical protein